jgi:hypothetical protein
MPHLFSDSYLLLLELSYYRDIVFMFKYLMTPDISALPEIKNWMQKDAQLKWAYKEAEGYVVYGFGRVLNSIHPPPPSEEAKATGWWNKLFGTRTRSPSGADPSKILDKQITNEEDILHIPELPSFGGKLTQANSELFISYLTVPYLRIPLVLNFFANAQNITALGELQIQNIIDSVVFEPGQWHPPNKEKIMPAVVPSEDRTFLATPLGLLFNELKMSPEVILKPLAQLLECALDLDPGKVLLFTNSL